MCDDFLYDASKWTAIFSLIVATTISSFRKIASEQTTLSLRLNRAKIELLIKNYVWLQSVDH